MAVSELQSEQRLYLEGEFMSVNATTTTGKVRRSIRRNHSGIHALVGAAAAAAAMFASGSAFAASGTWSGAGADGNWSTAGNWDNVPGAATGTTSPDVATFNSSPTNVNVVVDTDRNIAGITFDTIDAGAYTFTGPGNLLLTAGGTIQINDPVQNAQQISNNLVLEGSTYTITNNSANSGALLDLAGNISFGAVGTSGQLLLNGINPGQLFGNVINVGNAVDGVISNGNQTSLQVTIQGTPWVFNGHNTYTGTTTVDGANSFLVAAQNDSAGTSTIVLSNMGHLQASQAAPITIANDVQIGTGGGQIDGNQGVTVGGTLTFTGGSTLVNNLFGFFQNVTLNGPVFLSNSLATPRTITLDNSGTTVINGQIADATAGVGGSVNLFITSPGTVTMNGASTGFAGGVTLDDGTLYVGDNSALGTGTLTLQGGILEGVGAARTIANPIALGPGGTIIQGSQDLLFTGTVTNVGGNKTLLPQSSTNSITFAGNVYLSDSPSVAGTLTVNGGASAAVKPYTISGIISNAPSGGLAGSLVKDGLGNLILSGNNTYTGTTTINQGTLTLGANGTSGSVAGTINFTQSGTHLRISHSGIYALGNTITGNGDVGTSGADASGVSLGVANTYSGGFFQGDNTSVQIGVNTTVNGSGVVTAGPFGTGLFTVGTSSTSQPDQIVQPVVADRTIANTVQLVNNVTVLGSFNLTLSGSITLYNARSVTNNLDTGKTLTLGASGKTLTLNGVNNIHTFDGTGNTSVLSNIAQSGSDPQQLVKIGLGVLTLNGTTGATLDFATNINQGALVYNTTVSLETAGGGRVVTTSSQSNLLGAVGYAGSANGLLDTAFLNTLSLSSTGAFAVLSGDAARNLDFTTAPLSSFQSMSVGSAANITYSGTITPANLAYRLGGGSGSLTVSSLLSDNGGTTDTRISGGGGAVVLTHANTYTGRTVILPAGVLSIGSIANGGATSVIGASASAGSNLVISGTLRYTGGSATTDRAFNVDTTGSIEVTTAATNLEFDGAVTSGGMTKIGPGTLTLGGVDTYTGNTNVNAGTLTVASAGSIGSANVNVASGGTLNALGALASNATVNANGTTNFGGNSASSALNRPLAALNVGAGVTATVNSSLYPFTPVVLQPTALSFATGAKLDLKNNELISTGTVGQAQTLLSGGQVYSSAVTSTTGLGYGDAGGGNFEIRYTLLGDANLDGAVGVGDLGALATSYGITGGMLWSNGDFTGDHNVNVADLGALATNYGTQLGTGPSFDSGAAAPMSMIASSASVAAVPEPASLGTIVLGGAAMLIRRRRRV